MTPEHWFYLVFGGLSVNLGVIGNIFVIVYFGFKRKCKKNNEILIFLLGVTDFLASCSNLLFAWSVDLPFTTLKFDASTCKYVYPIGISINTTASYVLVAMFYFRYQSIANPVNNNNNKVKILIAFFVILIVNLLLVVPLTFCMIPYAGRCVCDYLLVFKTLKYKAIYVLLHSTLGTFLLPLMLMIYLCHQTNKCLKQSAVLFKNKAVNKRNKRALRTLISLITLFAFSVGTYQIWVLFRIILIFTEKTITWYYSVLHLFSAFAYQNNAMNFVIYAKLMPRFRRFILPCCISKYSIRTNSSRYSTNRSVTNTTKGL